MGVLAVAEALLEVVLQEEFLVKAGLGAHVSGNAGVVFGRMGIGLGREFQTGFVGGFAIGFQFGQYGIVIGRIADDGDVFPVLGSAANHGRAADVDVLDGILQGDALLRNGLLEGIEVHADQFDGLNAVLLQGFHVGGNVPAGQDAAVHLGMQGFHPAVANLRKTGHFTDADGFHALGFQEFLGTARGDDFPTQVYQALHKGHQSFFVTDTN